MQLNDITAVTTYKANEYVTSLILSILYITFFKKSNLPVIKSCNPIFMVALKKYCKNSS